MDVEKENVMKNFVSAKAEVVENKEASDGAIEEINSKLIDKFSVKGGASIVLELGTWEKSHGLSLKKPINRHLGLSY